MRKRLIVCDIDGVLCDCSARILKYTAHADRDNDYNEWIKSYVDYNLTTEGDIPIEDGIKLFWSLVIGFDADEFRFVTARGDGGFEPTYQWLCENVLTGDAMTRFGSRMFFHFHKGQFPREWLIMRKEHVEIEPGIFWKEGMPKYDAVEAKREEVLTLKNDFDIVLAIDDRPDVCQMYWKEGIHAMIASFPDHDCQGKVKEPICLR